MDLHEEFTTQARGRLTALEIQNVELLTDDGLELELDREFDAIAVTGSVPDLGTRFIKHLNPGGRLFVVAGRAPVMEALLITRQPSGVSSRESLFETVLPALENTEQQLPFVF